MLLHRSIKRDIRHAKEKWMGEELEDMNLHDSFNMHRILKEVATFKRKPPIVLGDTNNRPILEEE